MNKPGQVKKIPADKTLQQKVGLGKIDDKAVADAQRVLDESDIDFLPIARPYLNALQQAIKDAKAKDADMDKAFEALKTPIMNLKANAATFNYPLVSKITETVLLFLEAQPKLDKKMVQIVDLLHKTLLLMLARQMSGDGGVEGQALFGAFVEVCRKYKPKEA